MTTLSKDKDGNLLTTDNLANNYCESTNEDKIKVFASCQRFYISIFAPLVRGYLNNDNSLCITGPADTIRYEFEFNPETSSIKINAFDLTFNIGKNKCVNKVTLDKISFIMILKKDFERASFKDLRYDLIQQYVIDKVEGLDKLYEAAKFTKFE